MQLLEANRLITLSLRGMFFAVSTNPQAICVGVNSHLVLVQHRELAEAGSGQSRPIQSRTRTPMMIA